jgi:hypothetical protein
VSDGTRTVERQALLADYFYLCCNCGTITPFVEWQLLQRDDEGKLVPSQEGDCDPICKCPSCGWEHTDDDANPGIYDGARAELEVEHARLAADPVFADLWAKEVAR